MTQQNRDPKKYLRPPEQYRSMVKARLESNARTFPDRFWKRLDKTHPNGCWTWTKTIGNHGYGVMYVGRKVVTHRVAWELVNGPIPRGLYVLHKCDNRPCCNPAHLFLGTHLDNMKDMVSKKRNYVRKMEFGEKALHAVLTEKQAKEILQRYQTGRCSHRSLGKEYGVSSSTIGYLLRGKSWPHLIRTGEHARKRE